MLKRLNQYNLAVELIKRNARITIIIKETRVSKKLIKLAYRELIGRGGSSGPIKSSSMGLTRNMKKYKEATLFAVIFFKVEGKNQNSSIHNVIQAFDLYRKYLPTGILDFSTTWVIANDLKSNALKLTTCKHCDSSVLLCPVNEKSKDRCCVCKSEISPGA